MPKEKKYRIIFINKLSRNVSYEQAKKQLIKLFAISPRTSERLFNSEISCISQTDIRENALKAAEFIRQAGFQAKVIENRDEHLIQLARSSVLNVETHRLSEEIRDRTEKLANRASQLKEKISALRGDSEPEPQEAGRNLMPPIPDNLSDFLNHNQLNTVEKMQEAGWTLFFVRRSDIKESITVMLMPGTGETATVEPDGRFNQQHDIVIRH